MTDRAVSGHNALQEGFSPAGTRAAIVFKKSISLQGGRGIRCLNPWSSTSESHTGRLRIVRVRNRPRPLMFRCEQRMFNTQRGAQGHSALPAVTLDFLLLAVVSALQPERLGSRHCQGDSLRPGCLPCTPDGLAWLGYRSAPNVGMWFGINGHRTGHPDLRLGNGTVKQVSNSRTLERFAADQGVDLLPRDRLQLE